MKLLLIIAMCAVVDLSAATKSVHRIAVNPVKLSDKTVELNIEAERKGEIELDESEVCEYAFKGELDESGLCIVRGVK